MHKTTHTHTHIHNQKCVFCAGVLMHGGCLVADGEGATGGGQSEFTQLYSIMFIKKIIICISCPTVCISPQKSSSYNPKSAATLVFFVNC